MFQMFQMFHQGSLSLRLYILVTPMSRLEGDIFYVVCSIQISYWVPCRVFISHRPDFFICNLQHSKSGFDLTFSNSLIIHAALTQPEHLILVRWMGLVRWPTTVTAKELTSRQKEKPHGKKKNLTAKRKTSRQKDKPHGKKKKAHGKKKNLTAKRIDL